MDERICPICRQNNSTEAEICIHCGQRLKAYKLDGTENSSVINKAGQKRCPICRKNNGTEVEVCAYCGQRLKAYKLDGKNDSNYYAFKEKKEQSNKVRRVLIYCLLLTTLFIIVFNQQVFSVFNMVLPQKIINVNDMEISINQNDKLDLPVRIGAKMDHGDNKAVAVNWDTNVVDTSVPCIKIIKGKIDGYDKLVNFKVTVLHHQIRQSISDCSVENSMIQFNTNMYGNIKWIWFKVQKNGQVKDEIFPVNDGLLNSKVYLPFGAGDYQIAVLTSTFSNENSTYYEWKTIKVINNDKRDMSFLMPDGYVQCDSEEIRNLAYKITEKCVSDMEKTKAIHDWVAANIAYDVEALINNTVHIYSATETLYCKKAVCNGYANLTAALNRTVGIRTKIISGTTNRSNYGGGHAWNETYIDGKWIIQDTTWDAGGVDETTKKFKFKLSHEYFDPSPLAFSLDHTKKEEE